MKKIDLYYNPFIQAVSIMLDGEKMPVAQDRFHSCVFGNPMDNWLSAGTDSYKRWDGFLPEVMEYLNEDVLEICFVGIAEDYQKFAAEVRRQHRSVEDKGFDSDKYTLTGKSWDISQTRKALHTCVGRWKTPLNSEAVQLFDKLVRQLSDPHPVSFAQLEDCHVMALRIARCCKERCIQEEHAIYPDEKILCQKTTWENAERDISKIFADIRIEKQ